jgi:Flp pilus assembly pilin Flp
MVMVNYLQCGLKAWMVWKKGQDFAGQGLVEYALIILLIALVVFGALVIFGVELKETYQHIIDEIPWDG